GSDIPARPEEGEPELTRSFSSPDIADIRAGQPRARLPARARLTAVPGLPARRRNGVPELREHLVRVVGDHRRDGRLGRLVPGARRACRGARLARLAGLPRGPLPIGDPLPGYLVPQVPVHGSSRFSAETAL